MIMLSIDIDVFTYLFQNNITHNIKMKIECQSCESWINPEPTSPTRLATLDWNFEKIFHVHIMTCCQIIRSHMPWYFDSGIYKQTLVFIQSKFAMEALK